jgi:hypothetical protein
MTLSHISRSIFFLFYTKKKDCVEGFKWSKKINTNRELKNNRKDIVLDIIL